MADRDFAAKDMKKWPPRYRNHKLGRAFARRCTYSESAAAYLQVIVKCPREAQEALAS
jgi:hypothetical protein